MKDTLTLTLKLLIICAVVAALLAFVNQITSPIIEVNNQKTFEEAMGEVLPGESSFSEAPLDSSFAASESGVKVESVYKGNGGGFVISSVCTEGYGGDVKVMVGISPDLKVKQIKIMSMSETPGLGAKAEETDFLNQYNGLEKGISVVKNQTPSGSEIQAISGATITSKAVTKAVNAALEAAESVKEGK